jgi:hypothetical protein
MTAEENSRSPLLAERDCSPRLGRGDLKAQYGLRDAVLIFRSRELDLCLGLLQLRLAQFDDRRQSQLISRLREIDSEIGLIDKLLGYRDAAESGSRV